jgi:class 3 adenylate cyclase/ABC-type glycerol-3-phosphate transport system substrate-binding protein
LLALTLLSGVADAAPVELRYLYTTGLDGEVAVTEALIASFEAANPGVVVEPATSVIEALSAHDALIRMLALEDPSIDVFHVDAPWVVEFATPGWLLPIDGVDRAAFVPDVLEGGMLDGQVFAVPESTVGNLLYYRTDLVETAPTTLPELLEAAEAVRTANALPAGLGMHHKALGLDVLPLLWASGGGALDADGTAIVDAPVNLAVLRALQPAVAGGTLVLGRPGVRPDDPYTAPEDLFRAGQLPFLVSWTSRWSTFARSEVGGRVGVAPLPGLEGGSASVLGSWYLAANARTRHPEVARAFVRHMTSPEAQRMRHEATGLLPSRLAELDAAGEDHPHVGAMVDALGTLRPRAPVPDSASVTRLLSDRFTAVLRGETPAKPALAEATTAIQAFVGAPVPPASAGPRPLPPSPRANWLLPLYVALGAAAGLLLLVVGLWARHQRVPGRPLDSLAGKFATVAATLVLVILLLATGSLTSLSRRDQQADLRATEQFYAAELDAHARTIARQLALASSLLADTDTADPGALSTLSQLLLAGQFTDDVLFLELVDRAGAPLRSDQDIFATRGSVPPPRAGLADRVQHRGISVASAESSTGEPYLDVVAPVFRGGSHMGAVHLGISQAGHLAEVAANTQRHDATVARMARLSLLLGLVLLLGATLAILGLARQLAQPLVSLTANAARVRDGDLDVQFPTSSHDEVGTLSDAMADMVQGLRDRDFVRDVFGRYLTPEVAEAVLSNRDGLELGGHTEHLTILMSDLRGYTALTAQLGPQDMVALLNAYLGAMTEVIEAHGGNINAFIGDAILVLFGAPVPQDDHADRAARCAVAMQQAMVAFNADMRARGIPELAMGIGVCTGDVVAGNIGSARCLRYTVIGSAVNLAARIEGLTTGGQVLVAASTVAEATAGLELGPGVPRQVKGREAPLVVHELLGVEGARVPR